MRVIPLRFLLLLPLLLLLRMLMPCAPARASTPWCELQLLLLFKTPR
jgi:hypothetical protein